MNHIIEKIQKELNEIVKDGRYKDCYLVYNRKSTDEPNSQKNSIKYQKAEAIKYSNLLNLKSASLTVKGFAKNGIISERHSGFKESDKFELTDKGYVQYKIERPKFQILLWLLNKGYIKGVICLCWDRISRNKSDNTIIEKLMRRGVDFRFVHAKYDNSSSGALHMDIDGMFAQHHSRVTSEKVKLATNNARDRGQVTYRAPIGYLNLGSMEHKPLDPERSDVIKNLFKFYATGMWSLADLARYAKEQGVTTIPMRKPRTQEELLEEDEDELEERPQISRPLTQNNISRILRNPFYLGKTVNSNGEYIKSSSHEPLTDEETFALVQENLTKRQTSIHYTKKLELPFRGRIRCELCGRAYSPYKKKGIIYYGARCAKSCSNQKKSFNYKFVTQHVKQAIDELYFTDAELVLLDQEIKYELKNFDKDKLDQEGKNKRKIKSVKEKIQYLNDNKLELLQSGTYSPAELVREIEKLENEALEVASENTLLREEIVELSQTVLKISELLKNVAAYYDFANCEEKEAMTLSLFVELLISENTLKYKAQNGLECIKTRFYALGDPKAWLVELSKNKSQIDLQKDRLKNLLNKKSKKA